MATAGDGRAPYQSGGAGGKFRKRPFRRSVPATPYDRPPTAFRTNNRSLLTKIVEPASKLLYAGAHRLFDAFRKRLPPLSLQGRPESNEEPQNVSQDSGQDVNNCPGVPEVSTDQGGNSASISAETGISELEQMLQQKTFTRSEIQRLTSLLHSRTSDDINASDVAKPHTSLSPLLRLEASTSGSLKRYGEERDNFHAATSTPIVTSRVLVEEIASPTELAKSYMGSRPTKVAPSALGLSSQTLRQDSKLLPKAPVSPLAPKTANSFKGLENGFMTPRSRGRSAIYSMARTPYSRSPTTYSQKGIRSEYGHGAPATSQSALGDEGKMVLKRRSSLLEDDIGSGGPLRRVRQKANLFSLREKKELGYPSFQQPDDMNQKLLLTNKPEPKVSGYASVPTKSTQTANKILQHLEKQSPNEKSSGLTPAGMREKLPNELTLNMLHGQALRSLEKVDSPKFLCSPHDIQKPEVHQHARLHDSRESTSQIKDKIEENGSRKFPIPRNMLTSVNGDSTTEYIKDKAPIVGITELTPKFTAEPPQKKRAFQMSAPDDSFEIDDDVLDNGHMSYPSAEISKPETSLVANKPAAADDIIGTSKSAEVLKTPALVENNKPVFPEVAKVQEESELKEAKLAASSPKSVVGMFGGSVGEQKIGYNLPTSPPSATKQTSVISQSTLEMEKVAPEKDSSSFSFGTGVEKVSSVQLYANQSSESQQNASSDLKAHDSISVFNSVTKNDHVNFWAPTKDEIGNGNKYENDKKSASVFGKAVAPAVPEATPTNGSFLFGNPSTKLSSPNTTPTLSPLAVSASGASTNPMNNNSSPNVTSPSTTTTTAAIFSTSVPSPAFGFGSTTSTVSKTLTPEIGNCNAINGKEPKVNMTASPFGTSFATTTTTTAGTGLFGFSSAAAASTTTTGSGLFGFSSPAASSTTTAATTSVGSGLFGFSSPAASSTTTAVTTSVGSGSFGFSSPAATSTTATTTTTGSGIFGFSSSAATSTTTTTTGNGLFGFSSPAATSTTTTTSAIFGFSSPAATSTTTTAQSQGSFFNITSGSQGNTQASAAVSFSFGSSTPSTGSYSFSSATPAFGSSPSFGNGSAAASSEGKSGNSTSGSTTTIFGSTWQAPQQSSGFGSTFTSSSSSPVFSFGASSTPMFGSSNATSSFMTAGTTNSSFAGSSVFGNATPVFGAPPNNNNTNNNNDHMSMEDSMAEDSMQTPSPVSSFGQAPVTAPGFMFGSPAPTPTPTPTPAVVPFQFAGQMNQNQAQPQNPFQSSSLEFNAGGGSFSLGSGGEKSGRRIVRVVKSKNRKK